jgi:hypothetical protein
MSFAIPAKNMRHTGIVPLMQVCFRDGIESVPPMLCFNGTPADANVDIMKRLLAGWVFQIVDQALQIVLELKSQSLSREMCILCSEDVRGQPQGIVITVSQSLHLLTVELHIAIIGMCRARGEYWSGPDFCRVIKRGRRARFGPFLKKRLRAAHTEYCGTALWRDGVKSIRFRHLRRSAPSVYAPRPSFRSARAPSIASGNSASKWMILSVKSDKSRVLDGFSRQSRPFSPKSWLTEHRIEAPRLTGAQM